MAAHRRAFIASTLKKRIENSLRTHALSPGDRLPSTREVGEEFDVDPRVALASYQLLADDGLVVLKPRSGVFVAGASSLGEEKSPPPDFLADVLVAAVVRGFPLRRFTDELRLAALGRKLRVTVIAKTADQAHGISRELSADYGFETMTLLPDQLRVGSVVRAALQRAHLVVTTAALEKDVVAVADKQGKPVIVADARPPFVEDEWKAHLRTGRAYFVAVDPLFLEMMRSYVGSVTSLDHVKMLLAGRDDLTTIPPQAPTYVTEAARQKLGKTRIPGRLIAPPRFLAENCVRAIVSFIVGKNIQTASG